MVVTKCYLMEYDEFSSLASKYYGHKVKVDNNSDDGIEAIMDEGEYRGMVVHDLDWYDFRKYLANKFGVKRVMLNPSAEVWIVLID